MSVTDPLIEINPNNVTPSLHQQQPALGGQQQPQTPQQAWEQVISKLPLSLIMAIIDGFHDFCKGGRVAGNVNTSDGESDVAADVSDAVKKAYYRQAAILFGVYLSQIGTPTDQINEMISAMNNEKVGSVSNYERRVIKAMESRPELAPVLGSVRKDYSIQEIVNAPNSDDSDYEDGKLGRRPELWKEICGEVINVQNEDDKNAAIAAGPALYDKSLYLYWDQQYQLPQKYWRKDKNIQNQVHEPLVKDYQTYEPKFLKRLGNFIYTYLYPELSWSDDDQDKTAIVFDMASGCLGKIFGAFDKGSFRSSICPQTVSDSASTTENQIKSLNKKTFNRYNFCKTPNDISDDQNDIEEGLNAALTTAEGGNSPQYYKAQGNVLTWKYNTANEIIHTRIIYAIGQADQYTQATFCSFNVYICTRKQPFAQGGQLEPINGLQKPWKLEKLVFSVAEKNGPSVAYLSSLVYALENAVGKTTAAVRENIENTVPPKKKAMINITPLISKMRNDGFHEYFLQALLFDFKRCGDWEQSRSAQLQTKQVTTEIDQYARVFFGTGDILCSFFSRCTKGNCLWHYEGKGGVVAWNIELYRNPNITKALDPQVKKALEVVRKSTTIEKMLDRICHADEFRFAVENIKQLVVQHGHEAVYYYKGNNPAKQYTIQSKIEKLITMICRIGMKDVSYKCDIFLKLLNDSDTILKAIVGPAPQGQDVCELITNYYLMGLNYLRDIFTNMKVVSAEDAQRFMYFADAPNKNDQTYFTQDVNASIPPLQEQAGFAQFLNNRMTTGDLSQPELERLMEETDETTGIAAIIIAKRIIFGPDYGGNPDDKFFEFLAICEWLYSARQQEEDSDASINVLVTNYANAINGNPVINLKKALDLLKELKTTTKTAIIPNVGDAAQHRTSRIQHASKKKPIYHMLQLGEVDPIFRQKNAQGQEVGPYLFNKAFGGSKSLGAFKFRTTDMKQLAEYLKLMYYSGLKYRARIGTPANNGTREVLADSFVPRDNWEDFAAMVKQTMPAFQQQGQQPQIAIGWTESQVDSNSFRSYVDRKVNSAWPTLSTKYADILKNVLDFDCPAVYRIVIDGTIARDYVMTQNLNITQGGAVNEVRAIVEYCNSVYHSTTGKPIVEGLDIRKIARSEYNLDDKSLEPERKIDIVAQELGAFSRWLTILLDLDDSYQGVSPFSIDNLNRRSNFLKNLATNIATKATGDDDAAARARARDVIEEIGDVELYADQTYIASDGSANPAKTDTQMFEVMMSQAAEIIKAPTTDVVDDVMGNADANLDEDDDELGGGKKIVQKGGKDIVQKGGTDLTPQQQKDQQLTMLSYLVLGISGQARKLIAPLTDKKQLLIVLQKIKDYYPNKDAIDDADSLIAVVNNLSENRIPSNIIFKVLSLYSLTVYYSEKQRDDDMDFLGTRIIFNDIKNKINEAISDESNPLTNTAGKPFQGYSFKLLDFVLKLIIMVNNLHVWNYPTKMKNISTKRLAADADVQKASEEAAYAVQQTMRGAEQFHTGKMQAVVTHPAALQAAQEEIQKQIQLQNVNLQYTQKVEEEANNVQKLANLEILASRAKKAASDTITQKNIVFQIMQEYEKAEKDKQKAAEEARQRAAAAAAEEARQRAAAAEEARQRAAAAAEEARQRAAAEEARQRAAAEEEARQRAAAQAQHEAKQQAAQHNLSDNATAWHGHTQETSLKGAFETYCDSSRDVEGSRYKQGPLKMNNYLVAIVKNSVALVARKHNLDTISQKDILDHVGELQFFVEQDFEWLKGLFIDLHDPSSEARTKDQHTHVNIAYEIGFQLGMDCCIDLNEEPEVLQKEDEEQQEYDARRAAELQQHQAYYKKDSVQIGIEKASQLREQLCQLFRQIFRQNNVSIMRAVNDIINERLSEWNTGRRNYVAKDGKDSSGKVVVETGRQKISGGQKGGAFVEVEILESLKTNDMLLKGLNNVPVEDNFPVDTPDLNKILEIGLPQNFIGQLPGYSEETKDLIIRLVYLIIRSKVDTVGTTDLGNIKRELERILKTSINYSQSISPESQQSNGNENHCFLLPHIKLLLMFSGLESLLPAKNDDREKDPIYMLLFQNKNYLHTDVGLDFRTWSNWNQDGKISNAIDNILLKLQLFEENGNYKPFKTAKYGPGIGGKKTKKRRKRKKNTRKRKQNKKRKTRVKRDKRKKKKKKTRGRKKN